MRSVRFPVSESKQVRQLPARGDRVGAAARDPLGRARRRRALPSEAQLTAQFGVSRGTVRQALAALRSEGLINGGRGRPPRVARSMLAQSFDQMVSFSAWAESLGRVPVARTLELARRPADAADAAKLGLEPGRRSSSTSACGCSTASRRCSS